MVLIVKLMTNKSSKVLSKDKISPFNGYIMMGTFSLQAHNYNNFIVCYFYYNN